MRELLTKCFVAGQLMGQMGQPGVAGLYFFRNADSAFKREVGYVSSTSDTVDDHVFQSLELGVFLLCYMVHVRAVGYVSETEAKHRQPEVFSSNGDDFYSIYGERFIVYKMNLKFRSARISVFIKCV